MNDEYSELNDIILKRHDKSDARKKMLIGIGTLAIIAIVIVVIMGRISGSAPSQLPQTVLPQQAAVHPTQTIEPATPSDGLSSQEEQTQAAEMQDANEDTVQTPVPLAQSEIVVIDETTSEAPKTVEPSVQAKPERSVASVEPLPAKSAPAPAPKTQRPVSGTYYVQVGSFTQYKPGKAFLASIERNGYSYTFHRVVINGQIVNKVLVGPFKNRADATDHLSDIRRKIESGAFIYTIKP